MEFAPRQELSEAAAHAAKSGFSAVPGDASSGVVSSAGRMSPVLTRSRVLRARLSGYRVCRLGPSVVPFLRGSDLRGAGHPGA